MNLEKPAQLIRAINQRMVEKFSLTGRYGDADPLVNEPYGITVCTGFEAFGGRGSEPFTNLSCNSLIAASFLDYWAAADYGLTMGFELADFILAFRTKHLAAIADPGLRNLFVSWQANGSVSAGQPRAPLKSPGGQQPHIWIVDISVSSNLQIAQAKDDVCGYG